jgi:hypothetical protein
MEEVHWQKLEPGSEYYIERFFGRDPLPRDTHNADGIPLGQKKVGVFVGMEYNYTTPFAAFINLRNPPRDREGPYLPSALGTQTERRFSILNTKFYNVLPQNLKNKVRISDILEDRGRKELVNQFVRDTPYLSDQIYEYGLKGGKKARRNKKSKRTKKSKKTSKKSRKNKKRH